MAHGTIGIRISSVLAILAFLIILPGCATTVTEPEFRAVIDDLNAAKLFGAWYQGRKNEYDYFRVMTFLSSETYRVAAPNSLVEAPMPYTRRRKEWREFWIRTGGYPIQERNVVWPFDMSDFPFLDPAGIEVFLFPETLPRGVWH